VGWGGLELTWSSISMQNAASCGSRLETNFRPSFDDKILVRVLMDSALFVVNAVWTLFHCPSKSVAIAFARWDDGGGLQGGRSRRNLAVAAD